VDVEVSGTVREQLPSALYRVEIEGGRQVIAHQSGDVHKNFIRLLIGDRVIVRLAPNDPTRGRILRRL
jgi:translation initiation factor IF-1